jgi:CRP-like cAMP-binding protein
VGELAVLDPQPHSATVTALTPVTAVRLNKPAFAEAFRWAVGQRAGPAKVEPGTG